VGTAGGGNGAVKSGGGNPVCVAEDDIACIDAIETDTGGGVGRVRGVLGAGDNCVELGHCDGTEVLG
jgi:hypothetical protein